MHLATPSPQASGSPAHPEHEDGYAGTVDEATLDLLHGCIEAMSLLQAKFAGLEIEAQIKLDAAAREVGELRMALEDEMRRSEASAAQIARLEADNASWRLRAEADALSVARLAERLERLEGGVVIPSPVDLPTPDLATPGPTAAEPAAPEEPVAAQVPVSPDLRARLSDADANIADQRTRILSLQRKLAAVTREVTERPVEASEDATATTAPAAPVEHDILDLREVSRSLFSAA